MKRHLGVKINGPCYPHWFKRYKKSTYAGGKLFVVALLTMLVTFMTITTFQGKFGLSIKIFNELKWVRYPKHLIHSYSVVNRHQVDADPNLDLISMLMPIQVRIRIQTGIKTTYADPTPQVLHMFENQNFFTFSKSIASLRCFIFLISVKCVIIFRILDSRMEFYGKKFCSSTFHLLG